MALSAVNRLIFDSIITSYVPLIVQPVTSVHVPVASHVTVEELTVPSYPSAQDTVEVSPYVVPVVLE